MENHIHSTQCALDIVGAPHVALDEFSLGRNPAWAAFEMGGRFQVVENPHPVPAPQQQIHNMRADEARATSDKCF